MKNECNIVKDLLPLYIEDMVSEDTATFVNEHLAKCEDCRLEAEKMKASNSLDPVSANASDTAAPLKTLKKHWNTKKRILIITTSLITALVMFFCAYFIGSGFNKRYDVVLADFSVSEDGTEITLYTTVPTSMGYIRGFSNSGGGVKPHYLTFYHTFGGLNSPLGAQYEFILELGKDDTEIYFNRAYGGYELVLQKDTVSGEWVRPAK